MHSSADPLDDFFENGTIGLHLVGRDGIILRANRADFEPLGYSADEYVGRHIAEFHADPDTIEDILSRLTRGEALDKYRAKLRAKDGSVRHVEISSSVCFDDGEFVNTRCFTVDVTDKVTSEEALQEAQQRLAATYETVSAGIGEVDAEGRYLRVNEAFPRITGYSREELLNRTLFEITHPDDVEEDKLQFQRQVDGEIDQYDYEKRYIRPDGRIVWVDVTSSTVRDPAGHFSYGVRLVQDITARKEAEARQNLLLNELNHRVKNTLATVQSLAHQTARSCSTGEDFQERFTPRLIALSKAHDRLTRNQWQGASLSEIADEELEPYRSPKRPLSITGPDLVLPTKASLAVSMALHELATNSAKHGALSLPTGGVDLRWTVDRGGPFPTGVTICWTDIDGPAVPPVLAEGFGTRLLRVTAAELRGKMSMKFHPEGLEWVLSFPLVRESETQQASMSAIEPLP